MPVVNANVDVSGALSALSSFSFGGEGQSFPSDLRGHGQNFILFRALKDYQLSRTAAPLKASVTNIALPLPGNLSTSYNAQYSNEAIGAAGKLAADVAAGGGGAQGVAQRLVDKFTNDGGRDVKGALLNLASTATDPAIGALAGSVGGLTGAAAGAIAAQATKGIMAGIGVARNPHLATLFTGTSFRQHAFQYKLVARDAAESRTLRSIIRSFKFHMAPAYRTAGHFFDYPEQWDIDIVGGNYLFDIGASVLTQFDVGYGGEGAAYHFEDTNAPFSVTLSLTFQEVAITTKSEILVQGR